MRYKVISASPNGEFEGRFGTMKKYAIELEGVGYVELNQKPSTPMPEPGSYLEGEIKDITAKNGTVYKKFEKSSQFGGNNSSAPAQAQKTQASSGYENRRTALQCACMLEKNQELVFGVADSCLEWIEGKKRKITQEDQALLDSIPF